MPAANSPKSSIDAIRLSGGRACLDFVNTIHDRFAAVPVDYLGTPQHYVEWCLRTSLLSRQEADRITAAGVMGEVRSFREHLHALLSARIDGLPAPVNALRQCDRWLHQAWADLSLDPGSAEGVSWPPTAVDARLPLKRLALSALDLLRTAVARRRHPRLLVDQEPGAVAELERALLGTAVEQLGGDRPQAAHPAKRSPA